MAYTANPAEYWFWHAYKGIASSSRSPDRIVFRPAINSHTCIVIDRKDIPSLDDRRRVMLGYAEAARSWFWLIDPDEWESARGREISSSAENFRSVRTSPPIRNYKTGGVRTANIWTCPARAICS